MAAGSLLIGFLNVCLYCAVGKIVVALLCLIVIFSWLFTLLGVGTAPHFLWRW